MIYLTAQRLTSNRFPNQRTNAFLHRSSLELPASGDTLRFVDQVSLDPGELVSCFLEVPPGGNNIQAFVDVVANDDADRARRDQIFQGIRRKVIDVDSNEVADRIDSKELFRFYSHPSLDRLLAFDMLARAALSAFQAPRLSPLRVIVERGSGVSIFKVDESTTDRLRLFHDSDWQSRAIHVRDDISANFEDYHGSLLPHLIQVLMGIPPYYARGLGGVVFSRQDGTKLADWPKILAVRKPRPTGALNEIVRITPNASRIQLAYSTAVP